MAISAFTAQSAVMGFIFFMAIHALAGGLAKFFTLFMAARTGRGSMGPNQGKICLVMVKNLFVQGHNICLSPDMIGVALATSIGARQR